MATSSKRSRNVLSIETKVEIIKRLEKGETGTHLAKIFNVGKATISEIKSKKDEILKFVSKLDSEDGSKKRKTMKKPKDEKLEEAMFLWFVQRRSKGKSISGPLLCEKALDLNCKLGGPADFKASTGWLKNFKSRHGIRVLDVQGESSSGHSAAAEEFKVTFSDVSEDEGYSLDLVHNADDTVIHKTTTPTTFESPSVSCPPQSEGSFEGVPLTQTIIKEEIDVPEDDDYSYSSVPGTSVDEDQINFKTSFNEEETDLMDHGSMRSIELETAEPEESAQSSGLSDILKMADALSMNIQSILTDDISNFGHINPTRSANPRKSKSRTDTEPSLAFLKSKYTELESKLRIHYLNSMIKKEEELIDLKIKLYKMQIIREEEELNNNRQNQLLKVENLQLENTLLKTKLARKCNCKCSC